MQNGGSGGLPADGWTSSVLCCAVLAAAIGRTRACHVMVGLWPRLLSSFLPHHQVTDSYQKRAACVPTSKKKGTRDRHFFTHSTRSLLSALYQKQLPLVKKENRLNHRAKRKNKQSNSTAKKSSSSLSRCASAKQLPHATSTIHDSSPIPSPLDFVLHTNCC